jgi:hypothetical protein
MKEIFLMIIKMEKEFKNILTEISIMETGFKIKNMDMVLCTGNFKNTLENGQITNHMEKVS